MERSEHACAAREAMASYCDTTDFKAIKDLDLFDMHHTSDPVASQVSGLLDAVDAGMKCGCCECGTQFCAVEPAPAPTPAPTASPTAAPTAPAAATPTPEPTALPTPLPTTKEAAQEASLAALKESGNSVVGVDVALEMDVAALDAMKAKPQAAVDGLASGMATTLGADEGSVRVSATDPDVGAVGSFSFDRRLAAGAAPGRRLQVSLSVSYEVAVPPDEVTAMTSTLEAAKADTSALTSSINAELATSVGVAITGATVTSETFVVQTPYPTAAPTPPPTAPSPAPKPGPATPSVPTEEGGGFGVLLYVGIVILVLGGCGGGLKYANENLPLEDYGVPEPVVRFLNRWLSNPHVGDGGQPMATYEAGRA